MPVKGQRKTGKSNRELGIKVSYSAMVKVTLPKSGQCGISFGDGRISLTRSHHGQTKTYYMDLVECDREFFEWMQESKTKPTL